MLDELLGPFIKTDQRPFRIVRPLIHIQHLFHLANKLGVGIGRNDPLLVTPRLEFVFFSVFRTVSSLISSTICNSTNLSASNCRVH
jgi:hypothetical protein